RRNRRGRRHLRRDRFRHALVQIHDVVARQLRPFTGGPGGQRRRPVLRPVGAFHVVVGAQERVNSLRSVPHVVVRFARLVVPLVVLAGRLQGGELVVDGIRGGRRRSRRIGCVERQRRRTAERRA